jgi:hypothetical protein
MNARQVLLLRWFIYTTAFIGAGWYGLWIYYSGWTTELVIIAIPGGIAGLLAAALATDLSTRRPDQTFPATQPPPQRWRLVRTGERAP